MTTLFWTLFAYCVVERLGELVVSRRNQHRMKSTGFSEKETSGGVRCMVALHFSWYVAMLIEVPYFPWAVPAGVAWFAAGAFLLAQVLRFWTLRTLPILNLVWVPRHHIYLSGIKLRHTRVLCLGCSAL